MTERDDLVGTEFQGRKASRVVEFIPSGTFGAFYKSEALLKKLGYRTGSMCNTEPIGFAYKYDRVAKWHNLSKEDKSLLDGIVLQVGGFREGGVMIVFFNQPHLSEQED